MIGSDVAAVLAVVETLDSAVQVDVHSCADEVYRNPALLPPLDHADVQNRRNGDQRLHARKAVRRKETGEAKLQSRAALHDRDFTKAGEINRAVVAAVLDVEFLRQYGQPHFLFLRVPGEPNLVVNSHKTAGPPQRFHP